MKRKGNFLKFLRTAHGWLGIFVMPWVLIMGLTGFYLNHSKMVMSAFQPAELAESQFEGLRPAAPITLDTVQELAKSIWPARPIKKVWEKEYHGWPAYHVRIGGELVIQSISTGHYYVKTLYTRRTFGASGELVHSKTYWKKMLKDLHENGWLGGGLGTLLADILSISLILFGLSGSMMWIIPRIRKFENSNKSI
jgi:hypothetical protein